MGEQLAFRRVASTSSLGSCIITKCCWQGHAWAHPIGSMGFARICIELRKSGADHVKSRPAGRDQWHHRQTKFLLSQGRPNSMLQKQVACQTGVHTLLENLQPSTPS